MPFTLIPMVVFVAFALFAFARMNRRLKSVDLGPALRRFFTHTEYKFTDASKAGLEAQLALAEERMAPMLRGAPETIDFELVREYRGLRVEHRQYVAQSSSDANARVFSATWSAPIERAPKIKWQVASKRLRGAGQALASAVTHMHRNWSPAYPVRTRCGDAELDEAFDFYVTDAAALRRLVISDELKAGLLSFAEVDALVADDEISFFDPFQKNLLQAMGGRKAALSGELDAGQRFEMTAAMHDQIAQLLALLHQASTAA